MVISLLIYQQQYNHKLNKKILPKMGRACYAVRSMYHFSSMATLKMFYFAYFYSTMEYGIVSWGNSRESIRVFQLQKKIIKIITGSESRTSWKPLLQSLEILNLSSQCILSLLKFLSHTWKSIHLTLLFMVLIQK